MVQWKWQSQSRDWSNLEPDLLELIATRLQIKDIARMKSMCKAWCSVIEERDILAHKSTQQQQLPWLLFPDDSRVCSFYSLMDNSTSRFTLSDQVTGPNPRVYGSSYGWLVIRDPVAYPSFLVLNPLTQKHTTLPPFFPQHRLHKVILSQNPSCNSDWIAVAMYGLDRRLAIAKPGDLEWTSVHQANPVNDDMVIWKDNIYVIQPCSHRINLGVCSLKLISNNPPIPKLEIESIELELPHNYPRGRNSYKYLVVSSSGNDLLLVRRILESYCKYDRTRSFLVYKLEIEEEGTVWKWKKIETLLENDIIFLGINSSICLPASYAADLKCEPNCIYLADDNRRYRFNGHEVVVFDMVSRQLRYLSGNHPSTSPLTPPVWFMPSLAKVKSRHPLWTGLLVLFAGLFLLR